MFVLVFFQLLQPKLENNNIISVLWWSGGQTVVGLSGPTHLVDKAQTVLFHHRSK